MGPPAKIVLSASRRTDIPAFYMAWFMDGISKGTFEVVNPYNRRSRQVPAGPDRVHSIVFWSKNFGPFLAGDFGEQLEKAGYHLFFNFTVNAESPVLEPGVPPLTERLRQLRDLCRRFGPRSVTWRFDPVCHYRNGSGRVRDNLHDFERIARTAGDCGIRRCVTSFMDDYAKIRRRAAAIPGFSFVDAPMERQIAIVSAMQDTLERPGIRLHTCCEKDLMQRLPPGSGVRESACIPGGLLADLFGGDLSLKRDTGQRVNQGCGCSVSVDIGSYSLHPCYHNCLFCYANPANPNRPEPRMPCPGRGIAAGAPVAP